ncbi:MAG: hypothetical protein EBR82_79685 [Caulobacteraceae bacterium]|nr:hypothetical protein [Caulobacteraceae bacterium]
MNDTLYFVGYDTDDNPYISDNDGNDRVDLSTVDGDIELDDYAVSFWVQGEPIRMLFLDIKSPIFLMTDYKNSRGLQSVPIV